MVSIPGEAFPQTATRAGKESSRGPEYRDARTYGHEVTEHMRGWKSGSEGPGDPCAIG